MKYKLLLPIALTLSMPTLAEELQTIENPHTVFYGAAFSDISFAAKNEKKDFDDGAVSEFGYRYQVTKHFAFDTRYIKSSSIGFKQILSLGALDGTVDYSALVASVQGRLALTNNSFVYANAGASAYDWQYQKEGSWTKKEDQRKLKDSGAGTFLALGAKYQWSQVELSVENKWLTMGDVKASNFGVAIGYRF